MSKEVVPGRIGQAKKGPRNHSLHWIKTIKNVEEDTRG
jgi:hypothetical protein